MFSLEAIPVEALGALAAVVAGLFSLIPALGASDVRRAWTAIVVLVAGVFWSNGFEFTTWQAFGSEFATAAVYALATYKLFLQTIVLPAAQKGLAAVGIKAGYTG